MHNMNHPLRFVGGQEGNNSCPDRGTFCIQSATAQHHRSRLWQWV